jgi:hypothetical protein
LPKTVLPDGRQFLLANNRTLRITNPSTQEAKEIDLRYEAAGSYIFVVGSGPDGRIYGSSMLPLHLFSYHPAEVSFNQLSRIPLGGGEIYSMGSFDGKLYFCAYPGARLWVYDPKQSFQPGQGEGANPKDLGPLGDQQDRPRAMIAGPHGKVFIGSYPDYGEMGGAISVYVPQTDEKRIYRHVVENQSIASLVDVPPFALIVAGSSVRGGPGTRAMEKEAKLILWDPKEEKKIFELAPVPETKTILSLVSTKDGRVYGVTDTEKVFTFDIEKREIRKIFDLGLKDPRETSLQLGPGEKIYGLTKEAIFTIDPMTDQVSSWRNLQRPLIQAWPFWAERSFTARGKPLGVRNPARSLLNNRVIPRCPDGHRVGNFVTWRLTPPRPAPSGSPPWYRQNHKNHTLCSSLSRSGPLPSSRSE